MNKSICPICKKVNKCMAKSEKPCWCQDLIVPQELIDQVPEEYKDKSCICRSCIEKELKSKLII